MGINTCIHTHTHTTVCILFCKWCDDVFYYLQNMHMYNEINVALLPFHKHSYLFTYMLTQRWYSYEIWSVSSHTAALVRAVQWQSPRKGTKRALLLSVHYNDSISRGRRFWGVNTRQIYTSSHSQFPFDPINTSNRCWLWKGLFKLGMFCCGLTCYPHLPISPSFTHTRPHARTHMWSWGDLCSEVPSD